MYREDHLMVLLEYGAAGPNRTRWHVVEQARGRNLSAGTAVRQFGVMHHMMEKASTILVQMSFGG
jgi:hypothetical protein